MLFLLWEPRLVVLIWKEVMWLTIQRNLRHGREEPISNRVGVSTFPNISGSVPRSFQTITEPAVSKTQEKCGRRLCSRGIVASVTGMTAARPRVRTPDLTNLLRTCPLVCSSLSDDVDQTSNLYPDGECYRKPLPPSCLTTLKDVPPPWICTLDPLQCFFPGVTSHPSIECTAKKGCPLQPWLMDMRPVGRRKPSRHKVILREFQV